MAIESGIPWGCLTKRAPDKWESARFRSSFLASSFFCSQTESTPAHLRVTQIVRQPKSKCKIVFESQVSFWVYLKKQNHFLVLVIFLAVALASFSFWFTLFLGFKFSGLWVFLGLFNFRFCGWSKFWLIVACDYSACFLVRSLWRRFFSQQSYFLAKSGFQN